MAQKIETAVLELTVDGTKLRSGLGAAGQDVDKFSGVIKRASQQIEGVGASFAVLTGAFVAAQAVLSVVGQTFTVAVGALGSELEQLTIGGAGIADVSENFSNLTTQAGLLGDTLLGALRAGTHNTISDLQLMKMVNQDLSAGMVLTDKQFGTLAKGAFALAQATGVDVKTALDTMNDAMLTGRTRALAMLTGKIDLEAAETKFAKSIGTTRDGLTDEAKLEAARTAILDSVGAATGRLGSQTDGLDERVAQIQTTWQNFQDKLGETVAQSPVLNSALADIQEAMSDAFGEHQQDTIDAISAAIDKAAFSLVDVAEAGVQAGVALVTEWEAVKKVFDNVLQVIDDVRMTQKLGLLPGSVPDLPDAMQLRDRIDARKKAMDGDTKAQEDASETGKQLTQTLETLRLRMQLAASGAMDFQGPLEGVAKAAVPAKDGLTKLTEAQKQFAAAMEELKSATFGFGAALASIDGNVVEAVKFYLQAGVAQDKLAKAYHLTDVQIKAIATSRDLDNKILAINSTVTIAQADALSKLGVQHTEEIQLLKDSQAAREELNSGRVLDVTVLETLGRATDAMTTRQRQQLDVVTKLADMERKARNDQATGAGLSGVGTAAAALSVAQLEQLAKQEKAATDLHNALSTLSADFTQIAQVAGGSFGGALKVIGEITTGTNAAVDAFKILGDTSASALSKISAGASVFGAYLAITEAILQEFTESDIDKQLSIVGKEWGIALSDGTAQAIKDNLTRLTREALVRGVPSPETITQPFAGKLHEGAELLSLDQIIKDDGGLTTTNLSKYEEKLKDVFGLMNDGILTASEAAAILDKNFADMAKTGTDAFGFLDDNLKEIIARAQATGVQSQEITAYLQQQGDAAINGANDAISALSPEIASWQSLADKIKEATAAQNHMTSDGEKLSDLLKQQKGLASANKDTLSDLGLVALGTFNAALASGKSYADAIAEAGPGLSELKEAYDALGLSADNAAVKALLVQGAISKNNPALVQGVNGLGTAFAAMANMGSKDVTTFEAMERTGSSMYSRLQAAAAASGGTTKDALAPMQTYLHQAEQAAKDLGIPLDDNTQMLIDQSKELGLWKDTGLTAAEKQEKAFDAIASAMQGVADKLQEIADKLSGLPSNKTITVTTKHNNEGGDGGDGGGGDGGDGGANKLAGGGYFRGLSSATNFIVGEAGSEDLVAGGAGRSLARDVASELSGLGGFGASSDSGLSEMTADITLNIDGELFHRQQVRGLRLNRGGMRTAYREVLGVG